MISDYISREALLEKEKYLGDWNIDLRYVDIEDIKSIPSADVRENIHGEWQLKERGKDIWFKCNKCGKTTDFILPAPNYCSNCGADMRGDKE